MEDCHGCLRPTGTYYSHFGKHMLLPLFLVSGQRGTIALNLDLKLGFTCEEHLCDVP